MANMYIHTATIEFTGVFPFDMLRYDACYPASTEDVNNMTLRPIEVDEKSLRVKLEKLVVGKRVCPWTEGRWESFGSKIVDAHSRKL